MIEFLSGFRTTMQSILTGITTGDFSQFQAGWEQMKQGVIDTVTGLVNTIEALFVGVFDTVKGFVSGFVDSVTGFFKTLSSELVGHSIIPDMIAGIKNVFTGLSTDAQGIFQGMIDGIIGIANGLLDNLLGIFGKIGDGITKSLGGLFGGKNGISAQAGGTVSASTLDVGSVQDAVDQIKAAWNDLNAFTISSWNTLTVTVTTALQSILTNNTTRLAELATAWVNSMTNLNTTATNGMTSLHAAFTQGLANIEDTFTTAMNVLLKSLKDVVPLMTATAHSAAASIASQFYDYDWAAVGSYIGSQISANIHVSVDLSAYGSSVGSGFAQGITSSTGSAVSAAENLVGRVQKTIGHRLQAQSPSKVTERLGYTVPQGLALGVDKKANLFSEALQRMVVPAIRSLVIPAGARIGGSGNITNHYSTVNLEVNPTYRNVQSEASVYFDVIAALSAARV